MVGGWWALIDSQVGGRSLPLQGAKANQLAKGVKGVRSRSEQWGGKEIACRDEERTPIPMNDGDQDGSLCDDKLT